MARDPVLTRYVCTAVCARLADEGARVSIVLLALDRTGRASLGGLLVAALMVPHVLAAPAAGAAADAVRRRRVLYLAAFLAYASCLLTAALLIGPATPLAAVALVLAGCCAPLLIGGLSSLLGELAPDRIERAFALDATSYGAAGIAGPALAAVVAGLAGPGWSMLALTLLVVVAGLFLATLPLAVRPPREDGGRWRPAVLLAAVPVLWQRPRLGAVTAAATLNAVGMGALPLVAALLAVQAHRPALTGAILSTAAAGGLAGSLWCARFPVRRRPEAVLLACVGATAVPFLLVALVPAGWWMLPLFAVVGLLGAPQAVTTFAVRDQESPRDVRTQVFTLGAGLKVTGSAAGAAIAGLAAGAGTVALLAGVAACPVLGLAAGAGVLGRRGSRHARVPAAAEYR
ncbi:MAG TPA: MFS transporter [Actinoplanes sp.]|jgi:predicted MFS family arabinose efflux permease